ncbi:MBL fold metallo-hydrolase [Paenibacillus sp. P25]|nr:MBL fold metallo-hydrolase [Paenibacillus sp. P25]
MEEFLGDGAARKAFVDSLVSAANDPKFGFTGVCIDFEDLYGAERRDEFTRLITDIKSALGGKKLTVAVPPITYYQGYDLKAIGERADRVILMAYNFLSKPDRLPSSPLPLVAEAVQDTLEAGVPKEKLVLGIGKKTDQFIGQGGSTTYASPASAAVEDRLKKPGVQQSLAVPYLVKRIGYTEGGTNELFYEDADSIDRKIWLARYYGLQGIALWYMGQFTDADWRGSLRWAGNGSACKTFSSLDPTGERRFFFNSWKKPLAKTNDISYYTNINSIREVITMKMTKNGALYQLAFLPRLFPVNCYLVEEEKELTLVDAAMPFSVKGILQAAERIGKPITRIVLTHAHGDHIGALDGLKQALLQAQVLISARDAKAAGRRPRAGGRRAEYTGERGRAEAGSGEDEARCALLQDGDRIGSLKAIAAPGHTPGMMAFLDERSGALIAGDAFQVRGGVAVSGVVKPWFPFPAMATWNKPVSLESARKLRSLKPTLLAVGHGVMIADPLSVIDRAIAEAEASLA